MEKRFLNLFSVMNESLRYEPMNGEFDKFLEHVHIQKKKDS